jgi:hypothetical protein
MLLIKCAWVPVHHPSNSVAWDKFTLAQPPGWQRLLPPGWFWHKISVESASQRAAAVHYHAPRN